MGNEQEEKMTWFRLKGCAKCGGDLILDELDWLCLQCGTYYYTDLYQRKNGLQQPGANVPPPDQEKTAGGNGCHTGVRPLRLTALPVFDSLMHRAEGDTAINHNLADASAGNGEYPASYR